MATPRWIASWALVAGLLALVTAAAATPNGFNSSEADEARVVARSIRPCWLVRKTRGQSDRATPIRNFEIRQNNAANGARLSRAKALPLPVPAESSFQFVMR